MKVVAWVFGILVILVIVATSSPVKNFVGSMLGYGGCPNCGNSWFWTEAGFISYGEKLKEGKDFSVTGSTGDHIHVVAISTGAMFCKKCLHDPNKLDVDRIGKVLLRYGWGPEKVDLVKMAVNEFKIRSAAGKKTGE